MYSTTLTLNLTSDRAINSEEIILDTQATCLFNEAVRDGWNLEMDWLWLATRVSSYHQRRYALEQALLINPRSETARRLLMHLR